MRLFKSYHKATSEPRLGLSSSHISVLTLKVTLFWQCVESQMLGDGKTDFHLAIILVLHQEDKCEMCIRIKSLECCKKM